MGEDTRSSSVKTFLNAMACIVAPLHTLEFVLSSEPVKVAWHRIVAKADWDRWLGWCHDAVFAAYTVRNSIVSQLEFGDLAAIAEPSWAAFSKITKDLQAITHRDDEDLAPPLLRDLRTRFDDIAEKLRMIQDTNDIVGLLCGIEYRISIVAHCLMIPLTMHSD